MPVFRRDRAPGPVAWKSSAAADDLVHDAEAIVRLAWRRDLLEVRGLLDEQLQAAVADSLQAYEALRQAQRDSMPGWIAEAHMTFEAATRLTQTLTDNRDRIDALLADGSVGDSARPASAAPAAVTFLARVRQLAATVRSLICSRGCARQP